MIFWSALLKKLGYNYKSEFFLQDHFFGGVTTSGAIGELGWSSAGTVTRPSSTTNHPGQCRLSTGAGAGTQSRINFGQNSVVIDPSSPMDMIWVLKPIEIDTDTQIKIGINNPVNGNPATHGIYLEKLYADTNWFIVCRQSDTQTRVDSGVAVSAANWITFRMVRNSAGVQWYMALDGGTSSTFGALQTTNLPTTFVNPVVSILNQSAAAKTIDIDYFQIRATGLAL